jgi:hypothetical protein
MRRDFSIALIATGLTAALMAASPANAQPNPIQATANSSCVALGVHANGIFDVISVPNNSPGSKLAGQVEILIPCDDSVAVATLNVQFDGLQPGTIVSSFGVLQCIAPAIPGGCTPSGVPIDGLPEFMGPINSGTTNGSETRTVTSAYAGVKRGNYRFRVFVEQALALSYTIGQRVFSVQVVGDTPPKSNDRP